MRYSVLLAAMLSATAFADSGLVTMYARDPISQTFCFRDGQPGKVFPGGVPKNRCSDLAFSVFDLDAFSSGIEGGARAVIVDLGDSREYAEKHSLPTFVGNDSAFSAIELSGTQLQFVISDRSPEAVPEGSVLAASPRGKANAQAALGHLYLLRIVPDRDEAEQVFKLLVVAFTSGQSATFRWERLR